MSSRFLQIHTLTSYPGTLLNRDDAGFAKRLPFGGAVRTRISSQCLKRHWRTHKGDFSLEQLGEPLAIRSRLTFEEKLVKPLIAEGTDPEVVREVVGSLMKTVLGQSAKAEKKKGEKGEEDVSAKTGQVTVLGPKEVDYLLKVARELCAGLEPGKDLGKHVEASLKKALDKDAKKNLAALGKAAKGLDAALFGRMVTGDLLARGDAAIHVAHALTVHEEQSESDYFSAVDELQRESSDEGGMGSGHINSSELTSGLYYGYVVVDVPLLVANLEGCPAGEWEKADPALARKVLESLVQLIATVTPGAKLGSTAPYSRPHLIMLEAGGAQPRTLANAFLNPVSLRKGTDVIDTTYKAVRRYVGELDQMFPKQVPSRRLAGVGPVEELLGLAGQEQRASVDELASWAAASL